jgi:hypothetical protein
MQPVFTSTWPIKSRRRRRKRRADELAPLHQTAEETLPPQCEAGQRRAGARFAPPRPRRWQRIANQLPEDGLLIHLSVHERRRLVAIADPRASGSEERLCLYSTQRHSGATDDDQPGVSPSLPILSARRAPYYSGKAMSYHLLVSLRFQSNETTFMSAGIAEQRPDFRQYVVENHALLRGRALSACPAAGRRRRPRCGRERQAWRGYWRRGRWRCDS